MGLRMTWVNGFKVHHNGCEEAESQQLMSKSDLMSVHC